MELTKQGVITSVFNNSSPKKLAGEVAHTCPAKSETFHGEDIFYALVAPSLVGAFPTELIGGFLIALDLGMDKLLTNNLIPNVQSGMQKKAKKRGLIIVGTHAKESSHLLLARLTSRGA